MTEAAISLYLDLLKRCVINLIYEDPAIRYAWDDSTDRLLLPFDREKRLQAADWPSQAHTMIGMRRLDNIQQLVTDALAGGPHRDGRVARRLDDLHARHPQGARCDGSIGLGRRLVRGLPQHGGAGRVGALVQLARAGEPARLSDTRIRPGVPGQPGSAVGRDL